MSEHGGKPAWRRHFWLDYSAGGTMPAPGRGVWFALAIVNIGVGVAVAITR